MIEQNFAWAPFERDPFTTGSHGHLPTAMCPVHPTERVEVRFCGVDTWLARCRWCDSVAYGDSAEEALGAFLEGKR